MSSVAMRLNDSTDEAEWVSVDSRPQVENLPRPVLQMRVVSALSRMRGLHPDERPSVDIDVESTRQVDDLDRDLGTDLLRRIDY